MGGTKNYPHFNNRVCQMSDRVHRCTGRFIKIHKLSLVQVENVIPKECTDTKPIKLVTNSVF